MLMSAVRSDTIDELHELVRQSELSGARRRAALLHTDRLPPHLARPHHARLARHAMHALLTADRAQMFDLPHRRLAVIWRNCGTVELAQVREALRHLLNGEGSADLNLLTIYDLPDQAVRFLDQLAEAPERSVAQAGQCAPLDVTLLARLEAGLAQADLSRFVRRRAVVNLSDEAVADGSVAWHDLVLNMDELAAGVCPGRDIKGDQWLFRRLTRTLERRMLIMLATGRDFGRCHTCAIDLNVASILSPEFLKLDEALPVALRGRLILYLTTADILADPSGFIFARNFAQARHHRLFLGDATLAILRFFDPLAAGLDGLKAELCPELQASPSCLRALVSPSTPIVLTGLNRPSELRWARQHGFMLGQGHVLSP